MSFVAACHLGPPPVSRDGGEGEWGRTGGGYLRSALQNYFPPHADVSKRTYQCAFACWKKDAHLHAGLGLQHRLLHAANGRSVAAMKGAGRRKERRGAGEV